jgi:ribosomal protein S18 acetylase RimI-like enzyme
MTATATTGVLRRMQDTASRLWGRGRRWTPGEIAWSFMTDTEEQDVLCCDDGWAWDHGDYIAVLAGNPAPIVEGLPGWVKEPRVQASDGDAVLREVLDRAGFREVAGAAFDVDLRLATAAAAPSLPPGYLVRSAGETDDLLGAHRAAWRPADLPFAPGFAPQFDPEASSSLAASALAAVQRTWPYSRDLHVVAEAPDGSLAASCIAWLDPVTGVAAIEPLGVHPDHRRRGLAGALCLQAASLVAAAGGHELVIHPRGDVAYPAARRAYQKCGFAAVDRTRIYARP